MSAYEGKSRREHGKEDRKDKDVLDRNQGGGVLGRDKRKGGRR
jgi:hypothetical protein